MPKACIWLLAAVLALTLSGCGKPAPAPVATTAAPAPPAATEKATPAPDWRSQAQYASGTINADEKLAVLYRLEGERIAIYMDAPRQQALLTLDLSRDGNPAYSMQSLAFADKNDDGYNDLCLPLSEGGILFYLWGLDAKAFSSEPLAAEGLWLTIGDWPENAIYLTGEKNEEGAASYTWHIPDGPAFVLERLPSADYGLEAVREATAGFEALPSSAVAGEEDAALSEMLTYPAYRLNYHTEGDGGFSNTDVYVQTDEWDFRLHVVTPLEAGQGYEEQIQEWFASLLFQETNTVVSAGGT